MLDSCMWPLEAEHVDDDDEREHKEILFQLFLERCISILLDTTSTTMSNGYHNDAPRSWLHGLAFAVIASMIGAGSKLCIRKSYTILVATESVDDEEEPTEHDALLRKSSSFTTDDGFLSSNSDEEQQQQHRITKLQQREAVPAHEEQHLFLNRFLPVCLRVVGMVGMGMIGPACNVYALQFASPSVLSPIGGGLTLVWIILWSEHTIRETPRQIQRIAVALVVVGEGLVAAMGDHSNVFSLTPEDLWREYRKPAFELYFCGMGVWVFLLVGTIANQKSSPRARRLAWGLIGGSITGVQNFVKDSLALLHGRDSANTADDYTLPIMIVLAVLFPLFGLWLMMECMKRYDATYTASMFLVSAILSASIMSAVHYHTFDHLHSRLETFLYLFGLTLLLSGASLLATESKTTSALTTVATGSSAHNRHEESKVYSFSTNVAGNFEEKYGSVP